MKKWLKLTTRKVLLVILTAVISISPTLSAWPVGAVDPSMWVNSGELEFHNEGDPIPATMFSLGDIPCIDTKLTITYRSEDQTYNDCAVDTELGLLTSGANNRLMPPHASKIGQLDIGNASWLLPVPNQEKVLRMTRGGAPSGKRFIHVYNTNEGLIQKRPYMVNGFEDTYYLSRSHDASINRTDNSSIPFYHSQIGFSQNGKWMIARTGSVVVRVNLETLEVLAGGSVGTTATGNFDLAISNDGRYGAFGNMTSYPSPRAKIIDFSTCGEPNPSDNLELVDGCGERDLGAELIGYGADNRGAQELEFSSDGSILSMNIRKDDQGGRVSVVAPGYEYSGLDYLALGDSFISGEGDLDGLANYLPGTDISPSQDIPRGERCHVSQRSYPHLLARHMNLSEGQFKNISCSGAKIEDVTDESSQYKGQKERLSALSAIDLEAKQAEALNNFIPGRLPQWKFVEKYKPKVITLSIGGNDVDFDKAIGACAVPVTTCSDVSNDKKRNAKAREIIALTNKLKTTYEKLHQKSKNTKIFVVGYPQIIKKDGNCSFVNNSLINSDEREFMDEGFRLINDVIETAANRAGVKYLDAEEALGEAKLCGNEDPKAANGLQLGNGIDHFAGQYLSGFAFEGFASESYHPNNYGHARIASKVNSLLEGDTLLTYNHCQNAEQAICPKEVANVEINEYQYFQAAEPWTHSQNSMRLTEKDLYLLGEDAYIEGDHVFMPGSNVVMELHSEPVELGQFTVGADGTFNATVTLPDDQTIDAGLHTIHTYGTLLSGEEVDFYQTIFISGPEGDRDNNGVQDDSQPCLFVTSMNTDDDFDGVDDGCDGHVGDPELYRVRNGNQDNGENEDWLYVERNARASTVTGIQSDYDPDGDGWAVVAQSATNNDSGAPANFWVDEQNVPHVSIRHHEKGCVQLTPASLAKVEDGQARGLQQEAENTNTCRAEEPSYDADWDGIADDVQALYRARNGKVDEGEDENDVYIERNLTASEAQLGISDFVASNDWAIVGKAGNSSTEGTVNGEVTIEDGVPYICVQHATDGQIVLTPESLSVVKQSEPRLLMKENVTISCDN